MLGIKNYDRGRISTVWLQPKAIPTTRHSCLFYSVNVDQHGCQPSFGNLGRQDSWMNVSGKLMVYGPLQSTADSRHQSVFLEMGNFPQFGDFEGPLGNFIWWGFLIQMLGNFVCSSLLSKFTVSDIF